MIKISNSSRGFTLIELLTSIAVLGIVGSVVGTVLLSSLRGSTKTDTITNVKQNGNYAISIMGRMIRDAEVFVGVSTDGVSYVKSCVVNTPGPLTPTPTPVFYKAVRLNSFDGYQTTFSCNFSGDIPANTIASNGASLLDTSLVTFPSPTPPLPPCYFTCIQANNSQNPIVGIYFTLIQKRITTFFEQTAFIPFQTSIILRN